MAVSLSFDVDNETLSLERGNTAPVTLSAGEFGAMSGLPRVLDLLDRHDVSASFYIPAVSAMLHPTMIPEILERGRHEIGVHGWIHEDLVALDDAAEEERLLRQSIDYMTAVTGRVRGGIGRRHGRSVPTRWIRFERPGFSTTAA